MVSSLSVKSQNSSNINSFEIEYKKNLKELSHLYCWSDTSFYNGKFKMKSINNIQSEFKDLNFPFYQEQKEKTEEFYRFLDGLDIEEKQNLIRFFHYYENEFESALQLYGLPVQLKYLAPALSAMNPTAKNVDGKAGVWQLKHFQAVLNGIHINKLVDERLNVSVSTLAAAGELKQNFKQFETPELAIAAFLLGNVKVRNAIQLANRSGREVNEFFPATFSESVAAFQAMAIFLNANVFEEKIVPFTEPVNPDTVYVNQQLHFKQISKVIGVFEKELSYLNPQFKFSIVPGDVKNASLILPHGKWDDFVLWQDSIYSSYDSTLFQLHVQKIEYPPSPNRQYVGEPVKDLEIEGKTKIQYRLKTGDVLGIIAENFDVRVADLKYWNNIYNERKIQAGRKLDIFVDDDKADYYLDLATTQKLKKEEVSMVEKIKNSSTLKVFEELNSAKKMEHIVKSGESPYLIAKQYNGVTPDEILEWNNIDDARKIQIGQKLILYLK